MVNHAILGGVFSHAVLNPNIPTQHLVRSNPVQSHGQRRCEVVVRATLNVDVCLDTEFLWELRQPNHGLQVKDPGKASAIPTRILRNSHHPCLHESVATAGASSNLQVTELLDDLGVVPQLCRLFGS